MAKGNPLQEQLLKAGLVKKARLAEVAREQQKARHAKGPPAADEIALAAERARSEKTERDRALAAADKARQHAAEQRGQARRIIEDRKLAALGDGEYRFIVDGAIRSVLVSEAQRAKLSSGALVIARHGEGYAMLPREAADKVRERDPGAIVLDHAAGAGADPASGDEAWYARFPVPDDLVW